MNSKETHIIVAPEKELLPKELIPLFDLDKDCKAILGKENEGRLTNLIILDDKVLLFCKGTHGFTINEILLKNKPYITSDKDPDGLWTLYISASPRHFQLEGVNKDSAAQFTTIFEEVLDSYTQSKLAEEENINEPDELSERKAEEIEGQALLDDLTQKWTKDGAIKRTGLEWLPSITTIYRALIVLLVIGMVHSVSILFTSPYSLSRDRQALIELALKGDQWANKQLAINLDSETNSEKITESLNLIESRLNQTTGMILLSQFEKITFPLVKKRILSILIEKGMARNIEQFFIQSPSKTTKQEIIELTGEIKSVKATLLLHKIYQNAVNDFRATILIVLARKGDINFLVESYKKGSDLDCSNCMEAALSLSEEESTKVLTSFLQIEKRPEVIEKIEQLLKSNSR